MISFLASVAPAAAHLVHRAHAHREGISWATIFTMSLLVGLVLTAFFAAFATVSGALGHGIGHLQTGEGISGQAGPTQAQRQALREYLPAGMEEPASWEDARPLARVRPIWQVSLGYAASWLSPLSFSAALGWFGGGGLIGLLLAPVLAIPLAILAAIAGAGLVRGLMGFVVRSGTRPLSGTAEGALGILNSPIRADVSGEVVYTLEGLRRSAQARSLDGRTMPRGTRVVIVRREHGIAWVLPIDPLGQGISLPGTAPGKERA